MVNFSLTPWPANARLHVIVRQSELIVHKGGLSLRLVQANPIFASEGFFPNDGLFFDEGPLLDGGFIPGPVIFPGNSECLF